MSHGFVDPGSVRSLDAVWQELVALSSRVDAIQSDRFSPRHMLSPPENEVCAGDCGRPLSSCLRVLDWSNIPPGKPVRWWHIDCWNKATFFELQISENSKETAKTVLLAAKCLDLLVCRLVERHGESPDTDYLQLAHRLALLLRGVDRFAT